MRSILTNFCYCRRTWSARLEEFERKFRIKLRNRYSHLNTCIYFLGSEFYLPPPPQNLQRDFNFWCSEAGARLVAPKVRNCTHVISPQLRALFLYDPVEYHSPIYALVSRMVPYLEIFLLNVWINFLFAMHATWLFHLSVKLKNPSCYVILSILLLLYLRPRHTHDAVLRHPLYSFT
jgi:hypothetical protein